jgi:hypothetical protein
LGAGGSTTETQSAFLPRCGKPQVQQVLGHDSAKRQVHVRRPPAQFFHSVEEVAKLLSLTLAAEIGKAKYRGSKNRQAFNRARSALSG